MNVDIAPGVSFFIDWIRLLINISAPMNACTTTLQCHALYQLSISSWCKDLSSGVNFVQDILPHIGENSIRFFFAYSIFNLAFNITFNTASYPIP